MELSIFNVHFSLASQDSQRQKWSKERKMGNELNIEAGTTYSMPPIILAPGRFASVRLMLCCPS
jgi:hypothetical protein